MFTMQNLREEYDLEWLGRTKQKIDLFTKCEGLSFFVLIFFIHVPHFAKTIENELETSLARWLHIFKSNFW